MNLPAPAPQERRPTARRSVGRRFQRTSARSRLSSQSPEGGRILYGRVRLRRTLTLSQEIGPRKSSHGSTESRPAKNPLKGFVGTMHRPWRLESPAEPSPEVHWKRRPTGVTPPVNMAVRFAKDLGGFPKFPFWD
jgi:hypothetical protein